MSRLDPRTTWRGLVGFLRAYPETWGLLALAAATMGVSWLAVGGQSASGFGTVNLAFGALVTIVGMGAVVRLAIRRSLANEAPQRLIVTIFTSYAVLVVSFASTYYVLANAGDLRDARAEVLHYAEVARRIDAGQLDPGDIPEHESRRAFGGMRERLWSGLESVRSAEGEADGTGASDDAPRFALPPTPSEKVRRARGRTPEEVVRFRRQARLGVAIDCLHLSVVTMTTLGYGDITPRDAFARLSTDVQVLASGVLVLVALARALSRSAAVEVPPRGERADGE